VGELGLPGCCRSELLASSAGDGRGSYRGGDDAVELLASLMFGGGSIHDGLAEVMPWDVVACSVDVGRLSYP